MVTDGRAALMEGTARFGGTVFGGGEAGGGSSVITGEGLLALPGGQMLRGAGSRQQMAG